jgi:hypothetical protein
MRQEPEPISRPTPMPAPMPNPMPAPVRSMGGGDVPLPPPDFGGSSTDFDDMSLPDFGPEPDFNLGPSAMPEEKPKKKGLFKL